MCVRERVGKISNVCYYNKERKRQQYVPLCKKNNHTQIGSFHAETDIDQNICIESLNIPKFNSENV